MANPSTLGQKTLYELASLKYCYIALAPFSLSLSLFLSLPLSPFTYFSFSPSLCLSILSSLSLPSRSSLAVVAQRTWPTLQTQRTNTAKRVAVYTACCATGGRGRACVPPSPADTVLRETLYAISKVLIQRDSGQHGEVIFLCRIAVCCG